LERAQLQHLQAANRIRSQHLSDPGPPISPLLAPAMAPLVKPKGMTWNRFNALVRLMKAHETLGWLAGLALMQQSLCRIAGDHVAPGLEERRTERNLTRWAKNMLLMDAWALRQRSWHRRGRPRDTPGEGTRTRLAREAAAGATRMESSPEISEHAEEAAL
jgi:hypothetical protein